MTVKQLWPILALLCFLAWVDWLLWKDVSAGPQDPYIMWVCPVEGQDQIVISDGKRKMVGDQADIWQQPGALSLWQSISRLEYQVYVDTRCTATEALRGPSGVAF